MTTATKILVTGGAGYIGSHTVVVLQQAGYEVLILDNLANSHLEVLHRIERITGIRPALTQVDLCDAAALNKLFETETFQAVIHFAGLKAVGESCAEPLKYYQNNVAGSLNLFQAMQKAGCKKLVFSSSATVYGDPEIVPITETAKLHATNPYGQSKLMIEQILRDQSRADPDWEISLLRYFNPVGAHSSALIGEDPKGIPNNLMPYVAQVAAGLRDKVQVFGNDYPTNDGTGVRDYIHVMDLAYGHLKALQALQPQQGCQAYNLGTGNGYSVLDVIQAFRQISGHPIPHEIAPRRAGDVAECYADPSHSQQALQWKAEHSLEEMIRDHWNWQKNNPAGYSQQ